MISWEIFHFYNEKKAKLTSIIDVISVEKAVGESLEEEPEEAGVNMIQQGAQM